MYLPSFLISYICLPRDDKRPLRHGGRVFDVDYSFVLWAVVDLDQHNLR